MFFPKHILSLKKYQTIFALTQAGPNLLCYGRQFCMGGSYNMRLTIALYYYYNVFY